MKLDIKSLKTLSLKVAILISKTSLPEVAFVTSLILSKYLLNADFQYLSEVIVPIVFFAIVITIAFYLYRAVLGSWLAARISSLPLVYALYSYSYLPKWLRNVGSYVLPGKYDTVFTSSVINILIIAILCGLLGYGVSRLHKNVKGLKKLELHKIVLFVVLFIFSVQAYKVASYQIQIRDELSYKPSLTRYEQDKKDNVSKPDIYYIVFDRYGNADALKNNFDYDNSDITNYLTEQGFYTNTNAQANYPFTMSSISSTLMMDYHKDISMLFSKDKKQTAFPYRALLNDPPVAELLRQDGYEFNQISSWWDFTRVGINAENQPTKSFRLRVLGKNLYLSDLSRDILNKSIMKPWLKKGITIGSTILIKYDNDLNPRQNFYAQKDAIKAIASNNHSKPQLTFAHILVPHDPYVFAEDGSETKYDSGRNDNGVDEKVKYVNAVKFINGQIKDMVDTIRSKSPNSVIILQADEGPYPKQFRHKLTSDNYYDPSELPITERKQKFGIFASYYMPGMDTSKVSSDINTPVNSFRFVLKNYLGYKIDLLPVCNFATGNKFVVNTFVNETANISNGLKETCDKLK